MSLPGFGGRSGRSTGPVVGRPDRSTDVHETCTRAKLAWPVDRAVDRLKSPHSRVGAVDRKPWPVDRAVDRPESNCSLDLARSTGRSTGGLNGQFFDRCLVDRPVLWSTGRSIGRSFLTLSAAKGQNFYGGYKYPI